MTSNRPSAPHSRNHEARDAFNRALGLVHDDAERRLIERRIAELDSAVDRDG